MQVYEQLNENARIIIEPEFENYFDTFGEPDGYTDIEGNEITPEKEREQIIDAIDRDGLWYYAAQQRCGGQWETVDSVGMIIGDIADTGYLEDLKIVAIES